MVQRRQEFWKSGVIAYLGACNFRPASSRLVPEQPRGGSCIPSTNTKHYISFLARELFFQNL